MKANIDFLKNIPIAHRGLHDGNKKGGDTPENSYRAFQKAIDNGYNIEMDVRLTKDNLLVVFHDDTLDRVTNGKGNVIDYTFEELQNFSLNNTDQKMMLFKDFLSFVNGKVGLLIEIKDVPKRPNFIKQVIDELEGYKGEFALQSFNPLYIKSIKKMKPDYLRGQLATKDVPSNLGKLKAQIISKMLLNPLTKPDFVSYDIRFLPYKRAKKKNRLLLGWTVRTDDEYENVKGYVNNIIFEHINPNK